MIFLRLENAVIPPRFANLEDSAIVSCNFSGKIVCSRKNTGTGDIPHSTGLAEVDIFLYCIIRSERQSVEWGIGTLKDPFGVLRLPLTADAKKRHRLISVCVWLLNDLDEACRSQLNLNGRLKSQRNSTTIAAKSPGRKKRFVSNLNDFQ